MKQLVMPLIGLVLALFLGSSCNKPSEVDLDIFDDQQIDVLSSDTFTIKAKTVIAEPPRTRDADQNLLGGMLLGNFNDPVFGNVKSDMYVKFLPSRISQDAFLFDRPEDSLRVDSVVLSLAYRLPSELDLPENYYTYGFPNDTYKLEVYRVTESLVEEEECLSDKSYTIESTPYLTKDFIPNLTDTSLTINNISNGEIVVDSIMPPQIRMRLPDNSLGEDLLFLLDAPISLADEEANLERMENEVLQGFCFKIVEPNGGIISFNPNSFYTSINIFFETDERYIAEVESGVFDTSYTVLPRQLTLRPSRFYHTNFTHDYTGTEVEAYIDSEELGEELLFLQGMQGLEVEMEFPYLDGLKNIIINSARLEFTAIQPAEDVVADYYPPPILVQILETIDGEDFTIEDLTISASLGDLSNYGGNPVEETYDGQRIFRYSMNLTGHFQRIIDGEKEAKLKLSPAFRTTFASRLVFAGNNHPELKPRLKIAYTDLN